MHDDASYSMLPTPARSGPDATKTDEPAAVHGDEEGSSPGNQGSRLGTDLSMSQDSD